MVLSPTTGRITITLFIISCIFRGRGFPFSLRGPIIFCRGTKAMSQSPIISLRGRIRRQEGGGWEWTGIWVFGALPDNERDPVTEEGPTLQPVPNKKKKGKRKFINNVKGARPFRYHVSFSKTIHRCASKKTLRTAPYGCYVASKIWIPQIPLDYHLVSLKAFFISLPKS